MKRSLSRWIIRSDQIIFHFEKSIYAPLILIWYIILDKIIDVILLFVWWIYSSYEYYTPLMQQSWRLQWKCGININHTGHRLKKMNLSSIDQLYLVNVYIMMKCKIKYKGCLILDFFLNCSLATAGQLRLM